jgi:hypothetical protein
MRMFILFIIIFLNASSMAVPLKEVSFLVGNWKVKNEDNTITYEKWYKPSDNLMLGNGQTIKLINKSKKTIFFEFLRIELDKDELYYVPLPNGQASVKFKYNVLLSSEEKAVFENFKHDFPKTITYLKHGNNKLKVLLKGDAPDVEFTYKKF